MQLVQIGEVKHKTILDMINEMASRQNHEIEALKRLAAMKDSERIQRRAKRRCTAPGR